MTTIPTRPDQDAEIAPSRISLCPSCPGDHDFLMDVYASTRREEMLSWGWNAAQQLGFVRLQFEARRRTYTAAFPAAAENVILCDAAPIGSLIIARSAGEFRLLDISILPEYRNRGVGTMLIENMIAESKQQKLPLRLSVLRGNPAIHVYEKLGFVVTGGDEVYLEMECSLAALKENPVSSSPHA
jgi:ribosomal protein S18 acetylase RimI-like enzyme